MKMRTNKICLAVLVCFLLSNFSFGATKAEKAQEIQAYQQKVKSELQVLTKALLSDLHNAQLSIAKLKREKIRVEENLETMRAWGIQQQNEKVEYYDMAAKAQQDLQNEKAAHEKTIARYHKIKTIMAVLTGFCFLLIYFRFGSGGVSVVSTSLGPWGIIATLAAPILSFAIGFGLVFIFF